MESKQISFKCPHNDCHLEGIATIPDVMLCMIECPECLNNVMVFCTTFSMAIKKDEWNNADTEKRRAMVREKLKNFIDVITEEMNLIEAAIEEDEGEIEMEKISFQELRVFQEEEIDKLDDPNFWESFEGDSKQ